MGSIMAAHRRLDSFSEDATDGIGDCGNRFLDEALFYGGEIAQNISHLIAIIGATDAEANSGKLLALQGGDDGLNTLMSRRATALADAEFAQWQVQVIADHNEVV